MKDRKRKTYDKVFEILVKLRNHSSNAVMIMTIMTDFECPMRESLAGFFPNARLVGCHFHQLSAINRNFSRLTKNACFTDAEVSYFLHSFFWRVLLIEEEPGGQTGRAAQSHCVSARRFDSADGASPYRWNESTPGVKDGEIHQLL